MSRPIIETIAEDPDEGGSGRRGSPEVLLDSDVDADVDVDVNMNVGNFAKVNAEKELLRSDLESYIAASHTLLDSEGNKLISIPADFDSISKAMSRADLLDGGSSSWSKSLLSEKVSEEINKEFDGRYSAMLSGDENEAERKLQRGLAEIHMLDAQLRNLSRKAYEIKARQKLVLEETNEDGENLQETPHNARGNMSKHGSKVSMGSKADPSMRDSDTTPASTNERSPRTLSSQQSQQSRGGESLFLTGLKKGGSVAQRRMGTKGSFKSEASPNTDDDVSQFSNTARSGADSTFHDQEHDVDDECEEMREGMNGNTAGNNGDAHHSGKNKQAKPKRNFIRDNVVALRARGKLTEDEETRIQLMLVGTGSDDDDDDDDDNGEDVAKNAYRREHYGMSHDQQQRLRDIDHQLIDMIRKSDSTATLLPRNVSQYFATLIMGDGKTNVADGEHVNQAVAEPEDDVWAMPENPYGYGRFTAKSSGEADPVEASESKDADSNKSKKSSKRSSSKDGAKDSAGDKSEKIKRLEDATAGRERRNEMNEIYRQRVQRMRSQYESEVDRKLAACASREADLTGLIDGFDRFDPEVGIIRGVGHGDSINRTSSGANDGCDIDSTKPLTYNPSQGQSQGSSASGADVGRHQQPMSQHGSRRTSRTVSSVTFRSDSKSEANTNPDSVALSQADRMASQASLLEEIHPDRVISMDEVNAVVSAVLRQYAAGGISTSSSAQSGIQYDQDSKVPSNGIVRDREVIDGKSFDEGSSSATAAAEQSAELTDATNELPSQSLSLYQLVTSEEADMYRTKIERLLASYRRQVIELGNLRGNVPSQSRNSSHASLPSSQTTGQFVSEGALDHAGGWIGDEDDCFAGQKVHAPTAATYDDMALQKEYFRHVASQQDVQNQRDLQKQSPLVDPPIGVVSSSAGSGSRGGRMTVRERQMLRRANRVLDEHSTPSSGVRNSARDDSEIYGAAQQTGPTQPLHSTHKLPQIRVSNSGGSSRVASRGNEQPSRGEQASGSRFPPVRDAQPRGDESNRYADHEDAATTAAIERKVQSILERFRQAEAGNGDDDDDDVDADDDDGDDGGARVQVDTSIQAKIRQIQLRMRSFESEYSHSSQHVQQDQHNGYMGSEAAAAVHRNLHTHFDDDSDSDAGSNAPGESNRANEHAEKQGKIFV